MVRKLCAIAYVIIAVSVFITQSILAVAAALADDWPQWRGPRSDGTSREADLLIDWNESAPSVVWQRPLGLGFSSFSVVGDRLYTMAAVDDVEYVFCLDAASGETLWKTRSGKTYQDAQGGNGPRSTPAVVGDVVYALGV